MKSRAKKFLTCTQTEPAVATRVMFCTFCFFFVCFRKNEKYIRSAEEKIYNLNLGHHYSDDNDNGLWPLTGDDLMLLLLAIAAPALAAATSADAIPAAENAFHAWLVIGKHKLS